MGKRLGCRAGLGNARPRSPEDNGKELVAIASPPTTVGYSRFPDQVWRCRAAAGGMQPRGKAGGGRGAEV